MTAEHHRLIRNSAAFALVVGLAVVAAAQSGGKPKLANVDPARIAEVFPAHTFTVVNPAEGQPERIDLAQIIGRKPIVFCYWIAKSRRAEETLERLQAIADEVGPSKVAIFGVAMPGPGHEVEVIQERIKALDVHFPVLADEEFRLGKQLMVAKVPSIAILDREGKLRLVNGGSLQQNLEYKMDVEDAVRRVATRGTLGTYGYLPQYDPATELVGKPCPDFSAPEIVDGIERRWSSLMDSKKVNVIVFWSVDCGHCKKQLPIINAWLRDNPDRVNLVSAATVKNEAMETRTREFTQLNEFTFPTLKDEHRKLADPFNITSTPTIFVVGPDGVVDSLLAPTVNFGAAMDKKVKELKTGT